MPDAVAAVEPVTEEVTQTPVLITEQEVVFSTAAAVPVRPAKTRRGLTAVLRGILVSPTANAEKSRRHYPPRRNSLLEHTAMAREMHRLRTTHRSISIRYWILPRLNGTHGLIRLVRSRPRGASLCEGTAAQSDTTTDCRADASPRLPNRRILSKM